MKNGRALYKASEGYQKETKIATYEGKSDEEDNDEDNVQEAVLSEKKTINIVKIEGEFDMPMSILDIDRFERMNVGSVHHYELINDLAKLVNFIRKRAPRGWNEICLRCFHTCSSLDVLHRHQAICY